jgi:prepilin-type processing-associated H-X9-DG protein
MQCANQIKQLAIAMHNHHDAYNTLPARCWGEAGAGTAAATRPNDEAVSETLPATIAATGGNRQRLGAWVKILPFIEQNAVYDIITANPCVAPINSSNASWIGYKKGDNDAAAVSYNPWRMKITPLLCPSDSTSNGRLIGTVQWSNYCVSQGDWAGHTQTVSNGIYPQPKTRGVFAAIVERGLKDIEDGTSNTLFISERLVSSLPPNAIVGGRPVKNSTIVRITGDTDGALENRFNNKDTAGDDDYTNVNPKNCMDMRGSSEYYRDDIVTADIVGDPPTITWGEGGPWMNLFNTILPPNSPTCDATDSQCNDRLINPPTSYHAGGVNVAMADASGRFISDTIGSGNVTGWVKIDNTTTESPFGVWGALGSKGGGESAAP